jgi:hypothetical protein
MGDSRLAHQRGVGREPLDQRIAGSLQHALLVRAVGEDFYSQLIDGDAHKNCPRQKSPDLAAGRRAVQSIPVASTAARD